MNCPTCPHAEHSGYCDSCNCYYVPSMAHARTQDPWTSHAAAKSITSERIRVSQAAILDILRDAPRGMTDETLRRVYESKWQLNRWPKQSMSGLRTRRSELVERGLVRDSGRTEVLESRRRAIVWEAT